MCRDSLEFGFLMWLAFESFEYLSKAMFGDANAKGQK